MKKVDLIKFRCTPEFKARVAREATYRGVSLSEFVEGAIENELRPANSATGGYVAPFRPSGDRVFVDGEQAKVIGVPITPGLEHAPPVEPQCSSEGRAYCTFPECADGSCHPRRLNHDDELVGSNEGLSHGVVYVPATAEDSSPADASKVGGANCPHDRPRAACWECA